MIHDLPPPGIYIYMKPEILWYSTAYYIRRQILFGTKFHIYLFHTNVSRMIIIPIYNQEHKFAYHTLVSLTIFVLYQSTQLMLI